MKIYKKLQGSLYQQSDRDSWNFWVTMKKESLENWTLTRHTEGKRGRRNQQITYLMRLCEWMVVQRQINGQKQENWTMWRAMIAHVLKGHIALFIFPFPIPWILYQLSFKLVTFSQDTSFSSSPFSSSHTHPFHPSFPLTFFFLSSLISFSLLFIIPPPSPHSLSFLHICIPW